MYHSVTFLISGDWHPSRPSEEEIGINSWDDWHLIPTCAPVIAAPTVKTEYTELPIFDGDLDFTDALTGQAHYGFREGKLEFMVDNGHVDWCALYSEILDRLHGQYIRLILEDDPGYCYEGRVQVDEWRSEEHWSYVTISYEFIAERFEYDGALEPGGDDPPGEEIEVTM